MPVPPAHAHRIAAPTDTHVLLRAPRRFSHSAWAPRQRDARALDGALHTFLGRAGLRAPPPGSGSKPKKAGPLDGVYVDIGGPPVAPEADVPDPDRDGENDDDDSAPPEDEDDGLTWWAWDGTLTGFGEW
jgi:hypothetical protein